MQKLRPEKLNNLAAALSVVGGQRIPTLALFIFTYWARFPLSPQHMSAVVPSLISMESYSLKCGVDEMGERKILAFLRG